MGSETNSDSSSRPARVVRRRLNVTFEGTCAFALTGWVLASAFLTHASLILLAFCAWVAILIVSAALTWTNLRRVRATRRLPDHAVAGRPTRIECTVHNDRWAGTARAIVLANRVQPAVGEVPPSIYVPAVAARGERTERIELTLPHRGRFRFEPLETTSRFPFGFLERRLAIGSPEELLVYPRLGHIARRFFEVEREQHPHQEGRRPDRATAGMEYHGLHEFRAGDSPRWIHWPTSARRGRLMVKEFEARRNRDVALLLEPWLPAAADDRDRALLELAVSFAATLCVELCRRQGLHVVLGIAGKEPVLRHGQSSVRLLHELLEPLALVEGTDEPQWERLLHELPPAWTARMRITAISSRPLHLASHQGAAKAAALKKWRRLARRLMEVDVGSSALRDLFELH